MLLTINAPHIERRLQSVAQEQNTTPAELAERLLAASLSLSSDAGSAALESSRFSAGMENLSATERKDRFHRLLEENRTLQVAPLEPSGLSRDSFYEDERHLG